jgi:hypothetical protein
MPNTTASDNIHNLPIRQDVCFANAEGVFDERVQAQQLKLLAKIAPFLKRFLERDERILMASTARMPMVVGELFFGSYYSHLMRHSVLVFTDRRILQILTRMNYAPKNSISQIRYGDLESFDTGNFFQRNLKLKYKNGKEERFQGNATGILNKIKKVLPSYLTNFQPTEFKQRHNLCPRCAAPLAKGKYICPTCRLAFKNPGETVKYALIFPGGGFFYTRQLFTGIYYGLIEAVMLCLLVIGINETIQGKTSFGGFIGVGIFLIFFKLIHIYQARRYIVEYIPAEKDFTPTTMG